LEEKFGELKPEAPPWLVAHLLLVLALALALVLVLVLALVLDLIMLSATGAISISRRQRRRRRRGRKILRIDCDLERPAYPPFAARAFS
jgi:hypothetical protein